MTTQTLLTTAEAARQLGISTRTLARRAGDGTVPHVRKLDGIRGGYLFDAAVITLIKTQQSRHTKALGQLMTGGN